MRIGSHLCAHRMLCSVSLPELAEIQCSICRLQRGLHELDAGHCHIEIVAGMLLALYHARLSCSLLDLAFHSIYYAVTLFCETGEIRGLAFLFTHELSEAYSY